MQIKYLVINKDGLFYKAGTVNEWTNNISEAYQPFNENFAIAIANKFNADVVEYNVK